jgi:hypothetical protein
VTILEFFGTDGHKAKAQYHTATDLRYSSSIFVVNSPFLKPRGHISVFCTNFSQVPSSCTPGQQIHIWEAEDSSLRQFGLGTVSREWGKVPRLQNSTGLKETIICTRERSVPQAGVLLRPRAQAGGCLEPTG